MKRISVREIVTTVTSLISRRRIGKIKGVN